MTANEKVTGRTKTVLIPHGQKAVVSAIVVRGIEQAARKRRLRYCGSVHFEDSVKRHIRTMILPIIDRIVDKLRLVRKNFTLSVINLGAASILDVGVTVSGFSADLPLFIAMLSEALQVYIRDDFSSTGHIASIEGDVRTVKGIEAKVEAAISDASIKRFIYPDLEKDTSLKALSPDQRERSINAVLAAQYSIRTIAVAGIDDLIREVLSEEDIVLASLKHGFFDISTRPDKTGSPVSNAIAFLAENNERRFWNILQRRFSTGDHQKGERLLQAFVQFFLDQQKYPTGMGAKLYQLICSLPPVIRRTKMTFPLLDIGLCIKLSQFAQETDYEDVPRLFDAIRGGNLSHRAQARKVEESLDTRTSDSDCIAFDTVVSLINEEALAGESGVQVDSARASFVLESSTVQEYEDFIDILQAFYVHLQRYVSSSAVDSLDATTARTEAVALLERTFLGKGGDEAAFANARNGTQGGMPSVLNALTEHYKAERQTAYVKRVFKDAINAMDWDERVSFVRAAMKRLAPFLPSELRNESPERFVKQYEAIVLAYVKSLDHMNRLLRSM
jgi:hypothetical protein